MEYTFPIENFAFDFYKQSVKYIKIKNPFKKIFQHTYCSNTLSLRVVAVVKPKLAFCKTHTEIFYFHLPMTVYIVKHRRIYHQRGCF